jgi:tetraacyldisaccharide 4'-kinase
MSDINRVVKSFSEMKGDDKIVLTTEKDAMRLHVPGIEEVLGELPIYYIPVEVDFHGKDKEDFDENILTYVKRNTKSD